MAMTLNRLYSQTYNLAFDMAKQAKVCCKFETNDLNFFIESDNWDSGHAGLLAGERLTLQLQRLEEAMEKYGIPAIVNTDQGGQYTSEIFNEFVLSTGAELSMDGVGRATDHAFVERLWRTVKYENVRFSDYSDALKLRIGMDDYFPKYNERRHSSLNKQRPSQVYYQQVGISNEAQS